MAQALLTLLEIIHLEYIFLKTYYRDKFLNHDIDILPLDP